MIVTQSCPTLCDPMDCSLQNSPGKNTGVGGKTIVLTIWIFIVKVMSLLVNTLSRFVIAFLPRSKCLLISWLQSLSAGILESKKIKSLTVSIVSPSIYHDPNFSNSRPLITPSHIQTLSPNCIICYC